MIQNITRNSNKFSTSNTRRNFLGEKQIKLVQLRHSQQYPSGQSFLGFISDLNFYPTNTYLICGITVFI